jgi:hexosaminidase
MDDRLAGLMPRPTTVRAADGEFTIGAETPVTAAPAGQEAAEQAASTVRRALRAIPWPPSTQHDPQASTHGHGHITVTAAPELPREAYRLTITPNAVSIQASAPPGAFYATQTLRQLLPADAWRAAPARAATTPAAPWRVPCATIEDAPALPWRGAHLDVARHFFPKRELLALIDAFAGLRLNRLHLHLTDDQGWRMESRRYPALHELASNRPRTRISVSYEQPPVYDETPHGGYYTLADLAEINAYAADRMITVVPEIEVPGHATALLAALPELGSGSPPPGGYQVIPDWGIFPNLMSPLPPTLNFLRDIFAELLGAMPAKYVHIGGDECVLDSWRADPAIDAYRQQRGLASAEELHAVFLREVADLLADDFGARAVVWDEGFASTGGRPGLLRADTIVMAWRGMAIARRAAEAGHEVIASPVMPTYFDYFQSGEPDEPAGIAGPVTAADVAAFSPVPADWPDTARDRLIGTQFQVWTEYIRTSRELEYMIFPRGCVLADVAWSGMAATPAGQTDLAPDLTTRLTAQLARLDAAGLEYRPLAGPRPWQAGGTGPRRHRPGSNGQVSEIMAHLDGLAAGPS